MARGEKDEMADDALDDGECEAKGCAEDDTEGDAKAGALDDAHDNANEHVPAARRKAMAVQSPLVDAPLARWRIRAFAAGTALLLVIGAGYGVYAARRHSAVVAATKPSTPTTALPLSGSRKIVFVSTAIGATSGEAAEVSAAAPGGSPAYGPLNCDRIYAAASTVVCLHAEGFEYAEVYHDADGKPQLVTKVQLPGNPSRARVSPDGSLVAWTEFVSGDSYSGLQFSTRTGILNLRTGAVTQSLESFTSIVNGAVYRAVDMNFWGITFAADDTHFYATMGSAGKTWLMRGDLTQHTLTSVISNVECPSLSPDGTRIVFKKRVDTSLSGIWRLYVLDLATLEETPLSETRSIDDQVAWLDDDTVMYQAPQAVGGGYDIWADAADGTGTPKLLIPDAKSPAAVGG